MSFDHLPHGRFNNSPGRKTLRRKLRASATPAEAVLWRSLQRRQLDGRKFRRQHGIGLYVVDFCCPEERLVVELDGSVHDDPVRHDYDAERQRFLESLGYLVIRFDNRQVLQQTGLVLEAVRQSFST
jgi:very-short-patch-repair endonuclease